jgi:hypothetical protein
MRKVFVHVSADFSPDGELTPKSFVWDDGRQYAIDKVYEHKMSASLKVGGHGIRYRCRVMGKDVFIFFEDGRWFMEGK